MVFEKTISTVLRLYGLADATHDGAVGGRYSVRQLCKIKMHPVFRQLGFALGFLICAMLAWADSPRGVPAPEGLKGKVYFLTKPNLLLPDFSRLEPIMTIYTNPIQVVSNYERGFPGIPKRVAWFAIDYTGKIYIRTPGDYRFTLVRDMQFRNIEEFEKYRKFTGDSSISFEDSK